MFVPKFHRTLGPRRRLYLCALMATVSLAFPGCQPQSSSAHERIVSPRGAEVSFCSSQPVGCVPGTVFSVRDTQALAVETSIEQIAPGDHMQSLEIMMPDGRRYEETKVAFRVPENSNAPVPGVRMVPIAGTWIQTRQVTGIWKVRYSLDGKLLATSDFRLEP